MLLLPDLSLLSPRVLSLRYLRLCLLLRPGLLDPVRLHLALVCLRGLASMNLSLRAPCYRHTICLPGPLRCKMSAAATAHCDFPRPRALDLDTGASAGRKSRSRNPRRCSSVTSAAAAVSSGWRAAAALVTASVAAAWGGTCRSSDR